MERAKKDTLDRLADNPVMAPDDADQEATDANPVPLSPTQPQHRTSDGDSGPPTRPGIIAVPAAGLGSGNGSGGGAGVPGVAPIVGTGTDADRATTNDDRSDDTPSA